jgi:hypothetical protein
MNKNLKIKLHDAEKVTKTPGGGGHAALRKARRKGYYLSLPARTLSNKRRTFSRHLRHHPGDALARKLFAERYGAGACDAQITKTPPRVMAKYAHRMKRAARGKAIASYPLAMSGSDAQNP